MLESIPFSHPISSQVWFLLPRQDLESCGFANAVGTHKAEHLPRAGSWQTVQLEGVGTITVGRVLFQVTWQVNDGDCLKRTFLEVRKVLNYSTLQQFCTYRSQAYTQGVHQRD